MTAFFKRLIVFGVVLAAALEIVFRTVIPAAEMPVGTQDTAWGIMALDPAPETGHNSVGRFGWPRYRWQVNNYGFNSAWDYRSAAERDRPCAVVVGSSYVQGLYSDVEEHLAGQLQTALNGGTEVYNLGTSGMPFSQAPLVVSFAQAAFTPEVIVIQSGANSIANSLRNNRRVPYCQQYVWREDGLETLPPSRFRVNRLNRLLRHSAAIRYLYYNANYNLGGGGMVQDAVQKPERARDDGDDSLLSQVASRAAAEIRASAPTAKVVVVQDADRAAMRRGGVKPARLRNSALLEQACREQGFTFVDLTDAFWNDLQQHGKPFDFPDNYHWNPYAVSIVARAVADALGGTPAAGTSADAAAAASTE